MYNYATSRNVSVVEIILLFPPTHIFRVSTLQVINYIFDFQKKKPNQIAFILSMFSIYIFRVKTFINI